MGGVKIKRYKFFVISVIFILVFSAIPIVQSNSNSNDTPPTVKIVNPTKGYFHFSGIKLFPTIFNLISDTMGFGGFRVRPVQVQVEDDTDPPENLTVYM